MVPAQYNIIADWRRAPNLQASPRFLIKTRMIHGEPVVTRREKEERRSAQGKEREEEIPRTDNRKKQGELLLGGQSRVARSRRPQQFILRSRRRPPISGSHILLTIQLRAQEKFSEIRLLCRTTTTTRNNSNSNNSSSSQVTPRPLRVHIPLHTGTSNSNKAITGTGLALGRSSTPPRTGNRRRPWR